jgi:hypothetical protein
MPGKDLIRYDLLVQDALKGVVRKVLVDAAKDGLPGEHHFYISFRTDFPGVRLSNRLRDKYPQEMTIVLQHQFWELGITEHTFEVGLSFSNVPERLLIPFDALTGFFDPSVQFGLKFDTEGDEDESFDEENPAAPPARIGGAEPVALKKPKDAKAAAVAVGEGRPERTGEAAPEPEGDDNPAGSAEVVSLDSFRKKS